jgi:hypothetical protein
VGAKQKNGNNGAVYIFKRTDAGWVQQAKLVPTSIFTGEQFGASVSISDTGDAVAIGAPLRSVAGKAQTGTGFVFRRTGDVWQQEVMLTGANQTPGDKAGTSISIDGQGLVVTLGAPFHDYQSVSDSGAIFTFAKYATDWQEEITLGSTTKSANDQLATVMDLSSDSSHMVVGAALFDHAGKINSGAVVVFGQ